MPSHAVRKVSQNGIGYSIVDLNDVRHMFAAAAPRVGGGLRQQADDALQIVEAVIGEHGARGSIVHLAGLVKRLGRAFGAEKHEVCCPDRSGFSAGAARRRSAVGSRKAMLWAILARNQRAAQTLATVARYGRKRDGHHAASR